jgi:serine/threonine protein phosphatase PrpC
MTVDLTVCARTDPGLVRPSNEDAFIVADLTSGCAVHQPYVGFRVDIGTRGVLLAVSDGLGRHAAGEVASALVVESLRRALSCRIPEEPAQVDILLDEAVQRANSAVWHASIEPRYEGMAATLTAVLVHGHVAHIAEVGDSRAYVLRGGAIEQVTHDQSYAQLLIDSGVAPDEARHSPLGGAVLQAIGLGPEVSVALGRLALRRHDCLILCSDGLSNKVGPAQLRAAVAWSRELDVACDMMVDLALQRGGEDNITALVASVDGDLQPPADGERISQTFEVVRDFEIDVP